MSDSDPLLLYEVGAEGIATITFNRPQQMNAFSWPMMEALQAMLARAEKDTAARVIVLRGAGRCFSVGYDFRETPPEAIRPGQGPSDGSHDPRGVPEYGRGIWNSRAHVQGHIAYERFIWDLWKPVIAQVHGYALGGGSTLALTCDLTMMADDAKIGYPPTRWLAPGDNTAVYAFMAGLKKSKEMMFGRMFSGKEAESIGMINYSFPADRLEEQTRAIARRIATIAPELLMLNKSMINRVWEMIGIKTAMEFAGEFDSLAHLANTARPIKEAIDKHGSLAEAMRELNEPWGGV
ncbi:MAG: enoyl-CoA hydratase/isomerase family protein [Burkholderiales bacterium]|nr:enoyl-CoA hydratase/isomerase family protein [Burkholderiales bacterium]